MIEQIRESLGKALETASDLTETLESLQEKAAQLSDAQGQGGAPDVEAEVKRRMAAKLRADADHLEAGSNVPEAVETVPEEQPAGPGFPSDDGVDYPLAETVEEAQRILGQVEAEEYAKDEPDGRRIQKFRRHAAQTEAENR